MINGCLTTTHTAAIPVTTPKRVVPAPSPTIGHQVAAPSHSFTSDVGTGMFRVAASVLAWAIAGVEKLRLTATQVISQVPYHMAVNNNNAVTQLDPFGNVSNVAFFVSDKNGLKNKFPTLKTNSNHNKKPLN